MSSRRFRRSVAAAGAVLLVVLLVPGAVAAQNAGRTQVYAYSLKHQATDGALTLIRPLLSPRGTVEEQPGSQAIVVRDLPAAIERIATALAAFDRPPESLRFDIQVVRAGPSRSVISPPSMPSGEQASAEIAALLRPLLRYDDYRVLAKAEMSSLEGQEVSYDLDEIYTVSFRPGTVSPAGDEGRPPHLRLEGFRIEKRPRAANKGRRPEPRDLFHATLNLSLDRPFTLVLAQDEAQQEALVVAISCRREGVEP